ncbi:MAG: hypothetical protein R3F05_02805 [Planctomycetota bacterium]
MDERGGVNPWLLFVAVAALAGAAYAAFSAVEPGSGGHPAAEAAYARRARVLDAAQVTLPAGRLLDTYPTDVLATGGISGDTTDWIEVLRRRHDATHIDLDARRGGAVQMLLDLADRQARALERAGFDGMHAVWASDPAGDAVPARLPPEGSDNPHLPRDPGTTPSFVHVDHDTRSPSGGGHGGYRVDASARWVAHTRVYVVPRQAVTLFVRNQYDRESRTVVSEWSYADRSIHGTERISGSHLAGREPGRYTLHEWIPGKP